MADTDTAVDTDTVDTVMAVDTTEARGPLMPHPKLLLLPPLKPKPKLMPTVDTGMADTDTAVDTDTVDTVMAVDTTEARGPLMPHPKLLLLPPLKPKLMPTVDTGMVDTDTAVDTDTVDTVVTTAMDTDTVVDTVMAVDTDIMVELLLKQTNKTLKLQLSGSSHSKFFQFGYNAKTPSPLFFFET